ncbi:D-2-hydroxyglutaric acid dehydrogenase [Carabus blaptoides fortunei]
MLNKNIQLVQRALKHDLAKDKFAIKRGNFNNVNETHISYFKNIVGESGVLTNSDDLEQYNEYWFKHFKGSSKIVLKPKSTDEVSKILSFCTENKLAVCPQGGNTSISGASIAVFDEIILSLSRMNNVISLDELSDVLVCEAGCVLEHLNQFLADKELMMPIDLASKGSCQIGGNISTNAGGLRLFRYGSLQGSVLGLEVVKANGEIVDCMNSMRKDNTGYHLKHLFIGSEGTLGIITKVAIQCVTLPKAISVAFLGLESFDKVLATFKSAKQNLNETLSSCEMMDAQSMNMVQSHLKLKSAIGDFPFYLLLETSGCNGDHNEEKLNNFLEKCLCDGLVQDGTVSGEPSRCNKLWEVRERFAESMKYDGYVLCYDLSFPLKHFYTLVPELTDILGTKCLRVCGMGHMGDGNLHLQVSLKEYDEELKQFVDDIVYKRVAELKGSMSAEHGIGFLKNNILHYTKSPSSINLMHDIKRMLDPLGILNPYKVLNTSDK